MVSDDLSVRSAATEVEMRRLVKSDRSGYDDSIVTMLSADDNETDDEIRMEIMMNVAVEMGSVAIFNTGECSWGGD